MSVSFDYRPSEIHVFISEDGVLITYLVEDALSEMRRQRGETVEKTFLRLEKNLGKKGPKKSKAKAKTPVLAADAADGSSALLVEYNHETIDASLLLTVDLKTGMSVTLNQGKKFDIVVEPPRVTEITVFPKLLTLVGYPVIATAYAQLDDCDIEYLWYVEATHNEWILRGSSRSYTPSAGDLGKQIKVFCTPKYLEKSTEKLRIGRSSVHYLSGKVQQSTPSATPTAKILEIRSDFITNPHRGPGHVRVVTFNVLADQYSSTAHAINTLFNYCPAEYLGVDYRCQLALEEILAYNADVVCLQECDAKLFHSYYRPLLALRGYQGAYTNKASSVMEGCATFVQRLELLRVIDVPIKKILGPAPYLQGIYSQRPDLRDVLGEKLGGIGQISVCRSAHTGHIFLIINTHLFFHPKAGFVRLLQIDALLRMVTSLKAEIEANGLTSTVARTWCALGLRPGDVFEGVNEAVNHREVLLTPVTNRVSVLIAGDLNSTENSTVIEYLLQGAVSTDHEVWKTINGFRWGMGDEGISVEEEPEDVGVGASQETMVTPALTHSLGLQSAAGFPRYTNFTVDFQDLLDYVLIPADAVTVAVAPFPSVDDLTEHVALPSMRFPSDHVSVAVDLLIE